MKVRISGKSLKSESGSFDMDEHSMSVTSTHKESGFQSYLEQLNRLQRNYDSLKKICEDGIKITPSGDTNPLNSPSSGNHEDVANKVKDEIYVFFINCYHLKDWLIHDSSFPLDRHAVEDYINKNPDLQLCADICNAVKHFVLSRPRSSDQPHLGSRKTATKLAADSIETKVRFTIETKSGSEDAFSLATRCLEKWKQFIEENKGTP